MKHFVNVIQARILSNEGIFVENKKYNQERKQDEFNLKLHWKSSYSILWPTNIHDPIEEQFAQVSKL